MQIRKVQNSSDEEKFFALPQKLYANTKQWIRPLEKDVRGVFDKNLNPTFQHGECERFILQNESGDTLGRVAVFINEKTKLKNNDQPTGGMGFFECIENQQAAFMLFDACKQWLSERGCEAMDGSINFGGRDKFWGVLVEGFDREPNYQQNYNFPYYQQFFENYGFQVYFNQYTFFRKVYGVSEKVHAKANRIFADSNYHFENIRVKQLKKFAQDFRQIYNNSFALTEGIPAMTEQEAEKMMKKMKPVIDERLITFGYYKNEPVAFGIFLPELNQIFRYVDGKLDWLGKLKFLYYRWKGVCTRVLGVGFAVVKAHHAKGLDAALSVCLERETAKADFPYTDLELNWIGDFNPPMLKLMKNLEFSVCKKHITYRKLFDETRPFKRHPIRTYNEKNENE
ncbi:hypothetical protein [Raineya orbicola]|uniref:N-acetyltransferase domain-containing protein n=1 Tax=Raineya orbicola TaxID=2016530 RepID=A0A2N3IBL1_9BACT|nr:hypothetical protein [Raineya orbicola]PKQ67633.1 hypothetical protein Rain11_1978 [Raineya orbicola]